MVRRARQASVRLTAPVMRRAFGTAFFVLIAIACGPTSISTTQRTPGERVDINVNPATHAGSRDDPHRASPFNDRCFAPPVTP